MCNHPTWIYKGLGPARFPYGLKVKCGKCIACKIARSREWTLRLLHELEGWDKSCFITLTYSDKWLPDDGGLDKRDIQLFFKRLRKKLKRIRIRYYAAGEYGESDLGSHRPHYHIIVFGYCPLPIEIDRLGYVISGELYESWEYGNIFYGTVTSDSILYVTKYIHNKLFGELADKEYGRRQRPFQLCSQSMGLDYALSNKKQFCENLSTTIKGKPIGLPKLYKEKLVVDKQRLEDYAISRQLKDYNKYFQRGCCDEQKIENEISKAKLQNEVSQVAKHNLFRSRHRKLFQVENKKM